MFAVVCEKFVYPTRGPAKFYMRTLFFFFSRVSVYIHTKFHLNQFSSWNMER